MENLLLLDVPILKHIRGMTKNKKSIFIGVGGGGEGGAGKRDLVAGEFENKMPYFLFTTYCHGLFYRRVYSHKNIPNGI